MLVGNGPEQNMGLEGRPRVRLLKIPNVTATRYSKVAEPMKFERGIGGKVTVTLQIIHAQPSRYLPDRLQIVVANQSTLRQLPLLSIVLAGLDDSVRSNTRKQLAAICIDAEPIGEVAEAESLCLASALQVSVIGDTNREASARGQVDLVATNQDRAVASEGLVGSGDAEACALGFGGNDCSRGQGVPVNGVISLGANVEPMYASKSATPTSGMKDEKALTSRH